MCVLKDILVSYFEVASRIRMRKQTCHEIVRGILWGFLFVCSSPKTNDNPPKKM